MFGQACESSKLEGERLLGVSNLNSAAQADECLIVSIQRCQCQSPKPVELGLVTKASIPDNPQTLIGCDQRVGREIGP